VEKQNNEDVFREAAEAIEQQIKQTCPVCGRGAADTKAPDLADLEALIRIRDGFNKHRRSFTPLIERDFRRFDQTIGYLHRMIAGMVERG
jgi:hypothetical protein